MDLPRNSPQEFAKQRRLYLKESMPLVYAAMQKDGSLHKHLSSTGQQAASQHELLVQQGMVDPELQSLPHHKKVQRLQSLPEQARASVMHDVIQQDPTAEQ